MSNSIASKYFATTTSAFDGSNSFNFLLVIYFNSSAVFLEIKSFGSSQREIKVASKYSFNSSKAGIMRYSDIKLNISSFGIEDVFSVRKKVDNAWFKA